MHVRGLVKESLSRKLPYEGRLKNDIFTFEKLLRYVCGRMMSGAFVGRDKKQRTENKRRGNFTRQTLRCPPVDRATEKIPLFNSVYV